ncbi:MAG: hypothetical protein LBV29_06630 [Azoarcus sp.]|jgi:hypothetical protein|nr:hypothetical protein [Azoarcus sp.]
MKLLLKIALAAALVAPTSSFAVPASAPPEVQKEFASFIEKFRATVKVNDSAAVASMAQYPFVIGDVIRDPAEFIKTIYR